MRRSWLAVALVAAVGLMIIGSAAAQAAAPASTDWPQWRGANGTGISAETGWRTDWAASAPKTLWKAKVGKGFSALSVAEGRAYTMGWEGGKDTVWCLNADTGAEIWKHTYPCKEGDYPGPRCSPTVDGKVVYTLSREGDLFCLDAATGKVVWQVQASKQFNAKVPTWGFACSPVVLGDLLLIDVGPIVALKKASGELAWKGGSEAAGYATPFPFKLGSDTLIASFNAKGSIVVSAADGKVIGQAPWKTSYDVNAVTPIINGNTMFISSGYGVGAALYEVSKDGLKVLWQNKNMRNHANNCVLWEGFLYGFDGQVNEGPLTCIDIKTGERKWSEKSLKAGALMLAGGKLLIMGSKGDLAVVTPSPDGFKEVARIAEVLGDTCWTMPVLSGGKIFCRNHDGDVVCLDVKGK